MPLNDRISARGNTLSCEKTYSFRFYVYPSLQEVQLPPLQSLLKNTPQLMAGPGFSKGG